MIIYFRKYGKFNNYKRKLIYYKVKILHYRISLSNLKLFIKEWNNNYIIINNKY